MSKGLFSFITFLHLLLFIITIIIAFNYEPNLPLELSIYKELDLANGMSDNLFYIVIYLLLSDLIASIAIIFYKNWSRFLFAFNYTLWLILDFYAGPLVFSELEIFINDITFILAGFIIALMFFSNIKNFYLKENIS